MFRAFFVVILMVTRPVYSIEYKVRHGDTLSEILFSNVEGRIYGKNGNLNKLIFFNQQIENPDNLSIGTLISLENFVLLEDSKLGKSDNQKISDANIRKPTNKLSLPANKSANELSNKAKEKTVPSQLEQETPRSYLEVSLGVVTQSLNATDLVSSASEISTSDIGPSVSLLWAHIWSEKLHFYTELNYNKLKFNVAEGNNLDSPNITTSSANVGLYYFKGSRHRYSLYFSLREYLLLSATSASELVLLKPVIPSISISGLHDIYSFPSSYSFKSFWDLKLLMASSQSGYTTSASYSGKIGAGSYYSRNNRTYDISFFYEQSKLTTNLISETNKSLGIRFNMGLGF